MLLLRVRREDNENMLCKYVCILWELDQSQEIMGLYRIFYAYVFHVSSAYACSSLIIHLYIQLKYMKFYRGWSCLTAELFFFSLFCFTECFVGTYGVPWMSSHGEILESIKLAH